jgi:DNA-binding MarR family transcriptional regulator
MVSRLQTELQPTQPFECLEEEEFLTLQRTAGVLMHGLEGRLKPAGLSASPCNVLRILSEAGAEGLACGDIAARMVNWNPAITRLLDRLEARGLVQRRRDRADRRVMTACLIAEG